MIRYEFWGTEQLAEALRKKSETDFRKVERKNVLELRNRAVRSSSPSSGGTPVDSSELRMGASVSPDGSSFGYTKDYAPHVEFGHRTTNGGYVPGQYYLRSNVNIQKPIFRQDLTDKMRG
ncbi:hypothetical protein [Bacillus sp. FSL K6-3431]|uniref:hypothetical protein n=1 Tax=Bacillus sp. FSL K6-3431 TaxID=2921500 RepID=UPI0030FAB015